MQYIPRCAWNRKWEAHPEYLNKPCGVELIAVRILVINSKSYQKTHFFICHQEFINALVQGKLNIDDYFWIWQISRGEKWHEVLIIVKGSRLRQLDCDPSPSIFQNNICNDDLLCSVIDSFLLLFWYTKGISPVQHLHVFHLLFLCSFGYCA